jgi:hypothetical protein
LADSRKDKKLGWGIGGLFVIIFFLRWKMSSKKQDLEMRKLAFQRQSKNGVFIDQLIRI